MEENRTVSSQLSQAKKEVLRSQTRRKLCGAVKYFELRSKSKEEAVRTVAEIFEVSTQCVHRILREGERPPSTPAPGPSKKEPPPSLKSCSETLDVDMLRKLFIDLFIQKRTVSARLLTKEFNKRADWRGSEAIMRRLITKVGFRIKKIRERRILVERRKVAAARSVYERELQRIRDVPEESRPQVVWVDETIVRRHDAKESNDLQGERLIILHAGSVNGFVENAAHIICAKKSKKHELTASVFKKWFEKQLLPNIPPQSVILMDSAPVHSVEVNKAPTLTWKKAAMKKWLDKEGISYFSHTTRPELLHLVSLNKSRQKSYEIDSIARKKGHSVVRLPPYHFDLNPMELIWGIMKQYIKSHSGKRSVKDLKTVTEEALATITPEMWQKCITLTEQNLKFYVDREEQMDARMEEIDVTPEVVDSSSEESDVSSSDESARAPNYDSDDTCDTKDKSMVFDEEEVPISVLNSIKDVVACWD